MGTGTRAPLPQRGGALDHFVQFARISGASMSNVEFFLRAAFLILVIVAVSGAAIRLTRRN
jgi:hypothetical protein